MTKFRNSVLSEKDRQELKGLLNEVKDICKDFYITRNVTDRLFIKNNVSLLFGCLAKGDKITYNQGGIALLYGFSDKSPRKYIKVLSQDSKLAENLLKVLFWHYKGDVFAKIKKRNNFLYSLLRKFRFQFEGDRGAEILLHRKKYGESK